MISSRFLGTVVTDLGRMDFEPSRIEVTKTENEHEKAVLTVQSPTRGTDYYGLSGRRISFTYGTQGLVNSFQGYVAEIVPQQRYQGQQYVVDQEITCLGASMIMKGNTPRFLVDATVTDFIKKIVNDNGLGFSDEFKRDSTVWRTLAQTCESDWQMVVQLAGRLSASVVPQRGVVRLIDYNEVSYRETSSHFFQMNQTSMEVDGSNPGNITEFSPVNISQADPLYSVPSVAFLQAGKATFVPANGRGGVVSRRFATDMPARSTQEAQALQQGYYLPEWTQQGEINVVGDATIEPAAVCSVAATSGQASAVLRPDFDGMWYIQKVVHSMYGNQFFSRLTLGRAANRAPNWYQAHSFWLGDQRGIPQLIPSGDGKWLSSWR